MKAIQNRTMATETKEGGRGGCQLSASFIRPLLGVPCNDGSDRMGTPFDFLPFIFSALM